MLNLRLFHSSLNPRNQFSTVLIKTNRYTISCKYWICKELRELILPEGIVSINCGTFAGCSSLKKVYIPGS